MCATKLRHIRALSLDVTGTLIRHLDPIAETYAEALTWSAFPKKISADELKPSFKKAYFQTLSDFPCFGSAVGLSSRQWWVKCVKTCLVEAGLTQHDYSEKEFNRWFRRVYQHYGCPAGYVLMNDTVPFLKWATEQGYLLAVTTNTPSRTMDSVLPFMGLHQYFRCFTCSQDVGVEKPDQAIFDHSLEELQHFTDKIASGIIGDDRIRGFDAASFNQANTVVTNKYQKIRDGDQSNPALHPDQVLHIGDSMPADLCGPRAAGWLGMYLDRTSDPNVRVYQDWLVGPEYPGKSEEDIKENTVFSLDEVRAKLEACR